MFFKMPCWNCGRPLRASDENIGKKARCPYCGTVGPIRRPAIPIEEMSVAGEAGPAAAGAAARAPAGAPPPGGRAEGGQSRGTNVLLGLTGLIGAAMAAAFYLLCIIPVPPNPVREIFLERGLVPYVITFLTFWAAAMIFLKYRKLRIQRSALLFDVLPTEVAEEIKPESVEAFRSNLLSLPIKPEKSFLIGRVLRALNHYKAHSTRESVSSLLANQSEIDSNLVESSYSMIKVLVWAIPILGFIGTVMGVGAAVGSFSGVVEGAAEFAEAKEGLGNVTRGLGVAFDTTLLALIMSLLVMFPASALQKAEEDLLSTVDEYCNENVLRRLGGALAGAGPAGESQATAEAMARILADRTGELQTWSHNARSICEELTQKIADLWGQVHESLDRVHQRQVTSASEAYEKMAGPIADFPTRMTQAAQQVDALGSAQEQLAGISQQLTDSLKTVSGDGDLQQALRGVEEQLARNNKVLGSLGEQLAAGPAEDKGRWWSFSKKRAKA